MAIKMAVKKNQKNSSQRKKVGGPKGKNIYEGRSLLERIVVPGNTGKQKAKNTAPTNGLRVINGKLLNANDVGVLLRDAANKTNKKSRTSFRERKPNTERAQRSVQKIQASKPTRPAPKPYGKDLYLSLKSNPQNNFLRIRNLPLGSNSQELTNIVENIANAKLSKIKVIDLPSGSVTAEVWFNNSSSRVLNEVQRRLNRANVDGRVVSAEIASVAELH